MQSVIPKPPKACGVLYILVQSLYEKGRTVHCNRKKKTVITDLTKQINKPPTYNQSIILSDRHTHIYSVNYVLSPHVYCQATLLGPVY